MKSKTTLIVICVFFINTMFSQVGIGTTTPDAALDISSNSQGLLVPRLTTAQRDAMTSPQNPSSTVQEGTMIYNIDEHCLQINIAPTGSTPEWIGYRCIGNVSTLDCGNATHTGSLTIGFPASGVSSSISYTGGDGGIYASQTVSSTGVTGLTATLTGGMFNNGTGSLTYQITGTPSTFGTASFTITIGGQTCTFTRIVNETMPTNITLSTPQYHFIASIYDEDYLPYTTAAGPATTNTVNADGVNEPQPVDVQGVITTTGFIVKIPIIATGSGVLPPYSQTITIPASLTEDGISRDLLFSWESQGYSASSKTVEAKVVAIGGTLNAIKLDINDGIGNDFLGILLGQFTFPYNNAGDMGILQIRDIAGIPDRMFGIPDNSGNATSHLFLYLPKAAEDGKIWLNNNLGAAYANINHASFNIQQQATYYDDYLAYGSLFQWGRKADGHELINRTSTTSATPMFGTTATRNNNPTNSLFIAVSISPGDWRVTTDNTLWATEAHANNVCPDGFRVPTRTEYDNYITTAQITNRLTASQSVLKFSATGSRNDIGNIIQTGVNGIYWNSIGGSTFGITDTVAVTGTGVFKVNGYAVRCIKD